MTHLTHLRPMCTGGSRERKEISTSFERCRIKFVSSDTISAGLIMRGCPVNSGLWARFIPSRKLLVGTTRSSGKYGRLWHFSSQGTYIPRMSEILIHTYRPHGWHPPVKYEGESLKARSAPAGSLWEWPERPKTILAVPAWRTIRRWWDGD